MELNSFEIKNFRSIQHVKCVLSPQITILAGKNESGKTTILQALEALNEDWSFKETDRPLHIDTSENFELICKFTINEDEMQELLSTIPPFPDKINFPVGTSSSSYDLVVTRSGNNNYTLSYGGTAVEKTQLILMDDIKLFAGDITISIENLKPNIDLHGLLIFLDDLLTLNEAYVTASLVQIDSIFLPLQQNNPQLYQRVAKDIVELKNTLEELRKAIKMRDTFVKKIKSLLPRVVLFNSFNDILPPKLDFSEFINVELLKEKYRIVEDFAKLSNIDREKLASADEHGKVNITNRASRITSTKFGKFWHQKPIELSLKLDGQKVLFSIQDEGKETVYRPEQRSKGLQWYISFFLRLTSESKSNNLILIDEPGLYLHATAQLDVLTLFEELAQFNQIIFSTHSPYLIDASKLGRIRLVTKNPKTGNIEINNFHKDADLETLTPIITAIGLDLTKGFALPNNKNIIVEGISDYYYLQAMINYLKINEGYSFPDDITFIPCVGNTNEGSVASLLHGYGLRYKILLDRKGTEKTRNALIRDGIDVENIVEVGKNSAESIEDLFDLEDQKIYGISNNDSSKALTSKKFYEQIILNNENKILSKSTISNFQNLLDEIKKFWE